MAQVIVMERLRQAVWHGLEEKLGADKTSLQYNMASSLSGGRIFAAPTAYLRPNISSHGRGSLWRLKGQLDFIATHRNELKSKFFSLCNGGIFVGFVCSWWFSKLYELSLSSACEAFVDISICRFFTHVCR